MQPTDIPGRPGGDTACGCRRHWGPSDEAGAFARDYHQRLGMGDSAGATTTARVLYGRSAAPSVTPTSPRSADVSRSAETGAAAESLGRDGVSGKDLSPNALPFFPSSASRSKSMR